MGFVVVPIGGHGERHLGSGQLHDFGLQGLMVDIAGHGQL